MDAWIMLQEEPAALVLDTGGETDHKFSSRLEFG